MTRDLCDTRDLFIIAHTMRSNEINVSWMARGSPVERVWGIRSGNNLIGKGI